MKTLKVSGICHIEAPTSEVQIDRPYNFADILLLEEETSFMVDGLLANLGVGTVSRFLSSPPATSLPVLSRTGFSPVAL